MIKKTLITFIVAMTEVTAGFGAMPSKPDFAYPQTVKTDAEARLKVALKAHDGPATVRALMDYGLAETNIDPDARAAVMKKLTDTQTKVKSPLTKAVIDLVKADVDDSDSLLLATVDKYGAELKVASVSDWKTVVNADPRFIPTLYDFAAAISDNDSLLTAAIKWNAERPYPAAYLGILKAKYYDQMLPLAQKFQGHDVQAYVLAQLANEAHGIERRKEVYALCRQSQSNLKDIIAATEAYLTRSSAQVEGASVINRGGNYALKVKGICVNDLTVTVYMSRPQEKVVATHKVHLPGSGVFEADTVLNLTFPDYGEYKIGVSYPGADSRVNRRVKVAVTDFLLTRQTFGSTTPQVMPLDGVNGSLLSNVEIVKERNNIRGVRGNDKYGPSLYVYSEGEPSNAWNRAANIVTDRGIYHPGDSVHFAATLMQYRPGKREAVCGKAAKVVLRNANWQEIDTLTLTSDDFGRIHGEFKLPEEGLNGNFTLMVENYGSARFMVSDYKAPTFEVEMSAVRLSPTQVEIQGKAVGYNGFPIAGGQVAIKIEKLPEWVWYRNFRNAAEETVATDTVTTAADGTFTARFTVPAEGSLSASATVTSAIGESHDAYCFLPLHKYSISADIPTYLLRGNKPKIAIVDAKGDNANVSYAVKFISKTDSITPNEDWSNIPSGEYLLEISADDAAPLKSTVYVYSPDDKMPPLQTALFLPKHSANAGEKLLVGTSYADSHILCVMWTPDSIISRQWLSPEQGNFFIPTDLPAGVDEAYFTIFTLRNYEFHEERVRIKRPDVARALNMKVESMRDRVVPGQRETWRIRVADNLGEPVTAAVMLDVYSKSLDALAPLQWQFSAPNTFYGKNLSLNYNTPYPTSGSADGIYTAPYALERLAKGYELYGQHWPREHAVYYMRNLAGAKMMAVEECAVDCDEDAAPMMAAGATADNDSAEEPQPQEEYRLPEVPVAMWQPVLTTNADGSMQIEFTAPNANTTWAVRGLAYDSRLLSGLFGADIIAAKPVMVQGQLPRFLRMGDNIEIRASVMNNSDSTVAVNSFIEVFNPVSNEVIARKEFSEDIGSVSTIALQFVAPNASMVGVRIKATAGNFTDGEQSIIAILPNDVTVRTGRALFFPADSTHIDVEVPRGGVMTFTANATWECVTALPGLQTSQSRSALSSAATLFSAATARGLLRSYPQIGTALHRWEQEDSTLISALNKNEDLKIALLENTPWPGVAQSQTEQKQRLLLLFDRKVTDKTINDAISNLAKLVRCGGIGWTENSEEASTWITMRVLGTLAHLKRMGYLPDDKRLAQIIREGVTYLDNEVAREFAKDKNATFENYVLLRSQFPEVRQSAPAKRAAAATVQHIVGHWRDESLHNIAISAIILNENNYPTTARKLIESLRQHQVWKYRQIDAAYLEAFAAVEPTCPEVDEIRSAYIARKHSMDWGDGIDASDLIAAILSTGSQWLVPAANELVIKADSEPVHAEGIMGEFRINLPEGGKVEVAKGHYPAWGGIYSCSQDSINSVEAYGNDDLKITRTLRGEMKVGAKVTATLVIEAGQDLDYVVVKQPRCAAFEPVDQLPSRLWLGRLTAYREPCANVTNWFFNRILKGKVEITETFYITAEGTFALAPAEVQSQFAPEYQAHTQGCIIEIPLPDKPNK